MTIGAVIYSRLSTYSALTALVGTRFYPKVAPQSVIIPYVTWFRVDMLDYPGMGSTPGLRSGRYQFNAFHESELGMMAVWDKLYAAMNRWRNPSSSPVVTDSIYAGSDTSSFEPNTLLNAGSVDFMIHWQE